jgi:hypothetical protein
MNETGSRIYKLITHFSFEAKWVIKVQKNLAGRFKDIVNGLS